MKKKMLTGFALTLCIMGTPMLLQGATLQETCTKCHEGQQDYSAWVACRNKLWLMHDNLARVDRATYELAEKTYLGYLCSERFTTSNTTNLVKTAAKKTCTPVPEVCNDGIDNDCDGAIDCADTDCATSPACQSGSTTCTPTRTQHAGLKYADYPSNCLGCHGAQANAVAASVHYRWEGPAPDMLNQPTKAQGKLINAVNSYCINILNNWKGCGTCHVGRGLAPNDPGANNSNIDCLMCHNENYAMARVRLADGTMGVATPNDCYVQEVKMPTRRNCLKCHANAGGGDAVKRGDLSMATITNSSANFDVHMNTTGTNLSCQSCHAFVNHKVTGKGSDLRATDHVAEVKCVTCHIGMDSGNGHTAAGRRSEPDRHVARVACQSCHIPVYAKVQTEVHRDWRYHHDGKDATTCSTTNPCPGHPHTSKLANLIPEYHWWNRKSFNALLHDNAEAVKDMSRGGAGTYPTSRPAGSVHEGKLYPFKYKTAYQPMHDATKKLIALDTGIYLSGTGNVTEAIASGMSKMGLSGSYSWVTTDTLQLINHGVNPKAGAASCTQCHGDGSINLSADSMLDGKGYKLKDVKSKICSQCHQDKNLPRTWDRMHNHIAKTSGGNKGIDCYFCHTFTRPERGLCHPCSPCASSYVDTIPYPHVCQ